MSGQKSADPINVEDKPLDMESVKTPRNPDLISVTDAESPVVEQYRHLFSRVDLACKAKDKRVIAVTSCAEGEGKTVTVSNLAIVAARDFGRRVMLIDADFRHPTLSNYFKLESGKGLIDVLMRQADLEKVFVPGPHPNLTILPMGQWSEQKRKCKLGPIKRNPSDREKTISHHTLGRKVGRFSSNGKTRSRIVRLCLCGYPAHYAGL